MEKRQLVILLGGLASRLSPLNFNLPKGLLSVNQKPAIFNMLNDLTHGHDGGVIDDITFIVSPNNEGVVKSFVNKAYKNLNIRFIVQPVAEGPLQAFQLAEPYITKSTLLLLGDTLCETNLDYSYDWLGYQTIQDNSHSRWCLIQTDAEENVTDVIDKPDYTPNTNKVLIGLYNFTDPVLLKQSLQQPFEKVRGEYQLSSLISYYSARRQMKGLQIKHWYDIGTLKDYNETAKRNISGRSFNNFVLDDFNILTKTSSYGKLKDEIYWLEQIQNSPFKYLIPQFISSEIARGGELVSYKIEYVSGNNLAEYFCYYDIPAINWTYIFGKLIRLSQALWKEPVPDTAPDLRELTKVMYIDKTLDRIRDWDRQDILEQPFIYANGEKLINFYDAFDRLKPKLEAIINSSPAFYAIIHGDLCFSNVIFLPLAGTFKFIDPRGSFGGESMIYGDLRYDLAKLRHSYHGLYDYITADMFTLEQKADNEFEYDFFTDNILNPDIFDEILTNAGYCVDDIELLEGLLFISMIPLHKDDPAAQIMYLITGLKCLNSQINKMESIEK